jgi:hypothetical protein
MTTGSLICFSPVSPRRRQRNTARPAQAACDASDQGPSRARASQRRQRGPPVGSPPPSRASARRRLR